jgi:NAD(P)-dependent dehydrogenase (short-subunit alcohol dehydrogenase family)
MRLAAAAMAKNEPAGESGRGVIINTASIAAYEGQIGQVAYAAAKGGVVGMTIVAARDLSPAGVRVVTIAPGTFYTPAYPMSEEEASERFGQGIPFPRRMGRPTEYAALVQSIVENDYLNGETIRLDAALRFAPK